MALKVNNLRNLNMAAYDVSCQLGTEGKNLLSDLSTAVNDLYAIWKGEGSTVQINNLVRVYNSISDAFSIVSVYNAKVGKLSNELNKVSQFNGGNSDTLYEIEEVNFDTLEEFPQNTYSGVDIDSARAQAIIDNLNTLRGNFVVINSTLNEKKQIIFNEWVDSEDHDAAVDAYINLTERMEETTGTIDTVIKSVQTAIDNYKIVN